jgi:hypothetical protein
MLEGCATEHTRIFPGVLLARPALISAASWAFTGSWITPHVEAGPFSKGLGSANAKLLKPIIINDTTLNDITVFLIIFFMATSFLYFLIYVFNSS